MDFSTTRPSDPQAQELAPWEISLAKQVVYQFLAAHSFPRAITFKDLVQECLLRWWQQRHLYSPERGASQQTYMRAVLEKKLLDIARRDGAEKRRAQTEALSLNREIDDEEEDGTEQGDLVADEYSEWDPASTLEQTEIKEHIDQALSLLSPRQQKLAQALGSGANIAEISRALNIPRPTLYEEIKRIQKVFRDEGLEEFLK